MNYGSFFYILMLLLCPLLAAALHFLLRKRSDRCRRAVILALMLINLLQHLLKSVVYPMLYPGWGFNLLNTAYNMCALLIILSPLAFLIKLRPLRDFVFLAGSFAGFIANAIPYWYIGIPVTELGWDYARFYICHLLLFLTSTLTISLRIHRPNVRAIPLIGVGFLLSICFILLNDVIATKCGIVEGFAPDQVRAALDALNPVWSMHPEQGFARITDIIKALSPPIFFPNGAGRGYTPVLWYAIPVYLGITLISAIVLLVLDGDGRRRIFRRIKFRIKKH